jgi:hypothetical protein
MSFDLRRSEVSHPVRAPKVPANISQPTRRRNPLQCKPRWVFPFSAGIHLLLIAGWQEIVLNSNVHHQQLLNILGGRYVRLYASSG